MADNRRKTANGTRTRYAHPSKKELGQAPLPKDKTRNRRARYLAVKMLMDDEERMTIVDAIMDKYGYSEGMAGDIYLKAVKTIEKKSENLAEKVANINYERLDLIIEESIDIGENKTAIDAIDKMNKMAGIYEQKINVKTDEPVKIEFN